MPLENGAPEQSLSGAPRESGLRVWPEVRYLSDEVRVELDDAERGTLRIHHGGEASRAFDFHRAVEELRAELPGRLDRGIAILHREVEAPVRRHRAGFLRDRHHA